MRVLLSSQEMPPETAWGGIGTYVANLAPALAAQGAEVRVLSVVRGQSARDSLLGSVLVHRRPLERPPLVGRALHLPESWERLTLAVAVAREISRLDFEPDVVEAPEWRAEGLWLGLRRRLPLVVRLHSSAAQLFPYSGRRGIDARLATRLEHRSALAADVVVSTPSNLAEFMTAERQREVTGFACQLPVPLSPAAGKLPAVPRVTFVGRLERRKGPETLVAASAIILRSVPEARFTFVGADTGAGRHSYLDALRAEAGRLGVAHAVDFIGHRPHAEVMEVIRDSWLCAFPARQETFGYGAAEAAALGRAVVASDIPPFRSLFGAGDAAALVKPTDALGWATQITTLLRDPARTVDLGRAGRHRVREYCSPSHVAREMITAYETATERARRPR